MESVMTIGELGRVEGGGVLAGGRAPRSARRRPRPPCRLPPRARARGRRVGQLETPAGKSSQARFGGLTLVSRAPWLLVTGAPGLFSWPKTLWTTAVACLMSPTSRTGQAAASRRHRHRNRPRRGRRGRGPPTQAWMLHDWLTVDLNEMLPAAAFKYYYF